MERTLLSKGPCKTSVMRSNLLNKHVPFLEISYVYHLLIFGKHYGMSIMLIIKKKINTIRVPFFCLHFAQALEKYF